MTLDKTTINKQKYNNMEKRQAPLRKPNGKTIFLFFLVEEQISRRLTVKKRKKEKGQKKKFLFCFFWSGKRRILDGIFANSSGHFLMELIQIFFFFFSFFLMGFRNFGVCKMGFVFCRMPKTMSTERA